MQRQPMRRQRAYASREDSLENWSPVRYLQRTRMTISSQGCPGWCDGMLREVPEETPPCPYVLWEEEIQYWDRGWFISSGTTRSYLASITMFSLEKRYVRN